MAGQFGAWVPIGAVQTASGYDVAWKDPGYQSSIRSGPSTATATIVSDTIGAGLSGTSYTLESLEPIFNQDLNGDGSDRSSEDGDPENRLRSTSLTEVANEYFLENGGTGPALKVERRAGCGG